MVNITIDKEQLMILLFECGLETRKLNPFIDDKGKMINYRDFETDLANIVKLLKNESQITAEELHKIWVKDKIQHGWKYNFKKNISKKESPFINNFDNLPLLYRLEIVEVAIIYNWAKTTCEKLFIEKEKCVNNE